MRTVERLTAITLGSDKVNRGVEIFHWAAICGVAAMISTVLRIAAGSDGWNHLASATCCMFGIAAAALLVAGIRSHGISHSVSPDVSLDVSHPIE